MSTAPMVFTNTAEIGDTGLPTGFASPLGGEPRPTDGPQQSRAD